MSRRNESIPNILAIAGSDPSGGAGVQADLKSIAANGGYAMAALTALTAQNTQGVAGVHLVPPAFVQLQIAEVFRDVRVDAVKIGMIATAEIARAVAAALRDAGARNVVLDPVMIATSGDRLLAEDAVVALREELLPLARVLTPNLPEGAALMARPEPRDRTGMVGLAADLTGLGPEMVLLKGGHLASDESPDVLVDRHGAAQWFEGRRIAGKPLHGGGCTLSAAVATQLARTGDPVSAVAASKAYVIEAVARADQLDVGAGAQPLNHFPGFQTDWERSAT